MKDAQMEKIDKLVASNGSMSGRSSSSQLVDTLIDQKRKVIDHRFFSKENLW